MPNTATPKPASLELKIDSDAANIAAARHALEAFANNHGFGDPIAAELGLCANEALANVIRHAYLGASDRPILIRAEILPALPPATPELRVTIRDWGTGINPAAQPRKPYDPLTPGGVGLICLQKLMDDVIYTPQPDGMLLTITKRKC
jgi:anti-sigma regulatory factor (Ser/Thr protein kinase)